VGSICVPANTPTTVSINWNQVTGSFPAGDRTNVSRIGFQIFVYGTSPPQDGTTFHSTVSITSLLPPPPFNIFQWEYINPNDPSQGKRESSVLAADGYGLHAAPGLQAAGKNLTRAFLAGADLTNANLNSTNLTGADLTGAILTDANVKSAKLSSTHITLDQLYSTASYKNHDLAGVQFVGNDLSGANLAGQSLVATSFYAAKPVGANLTNANLTGAERRTRRLRASSIDTYSLRARSRSIPTGSISRS
jgi:hypothetical protein